MIKETPSRCTSAYNKVIQISLPYFPYTVCSFKTNFCEEDAVCIVSDTWSYKNWPSQYRLCPTASIDGKKNFKLKHSVLKYPLDFFKLNFKITFFPQCTKWPDLCGTCSHCPRKNNKEATGMHHASCDTGCCYIHLNKGGLTNHHS